MTAPPPDAELLVTRRRLVQVGGAATAAIYLGGLAGTASAAGVPSYLARSSYAGLTDTTFAAVATSGARTTLRLVEVADLARALHEPSFVGRDDAFGLVFSGPRDVLLDGAIHTLGHPSLGTFSLFISPVENRTGEQQYEVVVDRSVRLASAQQDAPEPMANSNAPAAPAAVAAAPAPAATAEAAAAATPAAAPKPAKHKKKKKAKLVLSALVARRGGVLTCDVRVAAHRGLVSVRATILRDGVEHARAGRLLRHRVGIRLNLRLLRLTPAGDYTLRIVVTDHAGKRTQSSRSVTIS